MKTFNCVIVDDEPLAREGLQAFINETPELNLVGSFSSGIDLSQALHDLTFDLIFLDIQMPNLTGIEFYKSLPSPTPFVIFTTAHRNHAIEAFNLDAVDYLLKPITYARFFEAIQKFKKRMLPTSTETGKEEDFIVKVNKQYCRILKSEVRYMESLGDYVKIFTTNKEYLVLVNLKNLLIQIDDARFFRIHKSFIINLNEIETVQGNTISLRNEERTIPIGTQYKEAFFSVFIDQKKIKR